MRVAYYEKLTLVDYPGKVAATVFTLGCVLRCPFCHSPELVQPTKEAQAHLRHNREEEFFAFLSTRRGKLDGVCITGGEPTLHKDLAPFIRRVKEMGFLIKLDTNGIFPDIVEKLIKERIVDYWAMDIKHVPDKYATACGVPINIARIKKSVRLIMNSDQDYEFRTTVVPGIHEENDFVAIARWIAGARAYYIQKYRDIKILDPRLREKTARHALDLEKIKTLVAPHVGTVMIRQ